MGSCDRWLTDPEEVMVIRFDRFEADAVLLGTPTIISLPMQSEGHAHAVCYWFQLRMLQDNDQLLVDTGPHNQFWQHWRQAAFLLPGDSVSVGERLNLNVFLNRMIGLWISA